jgi:hypothetical protein
MGIMSDTGIQRIYRHESTQYTTVPNWVVRDPKYTPNAFRLLAYLLSHANGYELTYGQIERQTTLGRYAINQAAGFLIEEGWLEWHRVKGLDGRWLAKQWIIKDPAAIVPLSNDSTMEPFHYGTDNGHKEEQLLEKNTSKETNLKSEAQFEEFWNAYPRKLDKAKAFRAFKSALTRAKFEDVLAGVLAYRNDPKRNPDFTKYPASWLNADSWENAAGSNEVIQATNERRERELERTKEFLEEQKRLDAQSTPAPKCPHGSLIVRCEKCLKTIG